MKYGYISAFSLCLLLVASCASDEKKCSKLKRGEFYYKSKGSFEGSRIQRYDSVQVVSDEKTGGKINEKIIWTGPCTYVLNPSATNTEDILKSDQFPITVTILGITDRYYTVHVSGGSNKTEFDDTAWISFLQ